MTTAIYTHLNAEELINSLETNLRIGSTDLHETIRIAIQHHHFHELIILLKQKLEEEEGATIRQLRLTESDYEQIMNY